MKLKDWLILLIPVAVVALVMLIPAVPDKIPMQFNASGEATWHLSKWIFPVFGLIPFLIYSKYKKK